MLVVKGGTKGTQSHPTNSYISFIFYFSLYSRLKHSCRMTSKWFNYATQQVAEKIYERRQPATWPREERHAVPAAPLLPEFVSIMNMRGPISSNLRGALFALEDQSICTGGLESIANGYTRR